MLFVTGAIPPNNGCRQGAFPHRPIRMTQITNIAAYKFVPLDRLPERRETLLDRASSLSLKGTILLAEEGINLFLAGSAGDIDAFLLWLREDPAFTVLEVKYSLSSSVPFGRLRVRIKREIIRMNHPAIRPVAARAPAVDAHTVERWLGQGTDDEGRPVVMLDTRNEFEVQAGTFANAINWHIDRFTQFPQAVLDHKDELAGKTVVSFCTGGIRCEKAAIFMAEAGVERVLQLDGGILKYFEETGGTRFEGTCFVFDGRETLDPGLQPRSL